MHKHQTRTKVHVQQKNTNVSFQLFVWGNATDNMETKERTLLWKNTVIMGLKIDQAWKSYYIIYGTDSVRLFRCVDMLTEIQNIVAWYVCIYPSHWYGVHLSIYFFLDWNNFKYPDEGRKFPRGKLPKAQVKPTRRMCLWTRSQPMVDRASVFHCATEIHVRLLTAHLLTPDCLLGCCLMEHLLRPWELRGVGLNPWLE